MCQVGAMFTRCLKSKGHPPLLTAASLSLIKLIGPRQKGQSVRTLQAAAWVMMLSYAGPVRNC